MNYYAHPYCSNSDLSKLKQELSAQDATDTEAAFHFGTLVHTTILEPEKLDLISRKVVGSDHIYSAEEIDTARKMRTSFINDSFCRNLLVKSRIEVEMYHPATRFSHQGIDFTLDTRRKYDGWLDLVNWGWDLKSTTCTSEDQFMQSVSRFDYDRARVFYAAGSGSLQDVIIGVSKVKPYRVFKVFMRQGDKLWQSGQEKCAELAFKYYMLKAEQTV